MLRFLFLLAIAGLSSAGVTASRQTPVIGILSQPLHDSNNTYIAASYVKWLEVGGARSIAIPYDATEELVHEILSQIDGVLFPGGGAPVPPAAKQVWRLLQQRYEEGDHLPLWGTCLGMEFIVQLATNQFDADDDHLVSPLENGYDATNISLPLLNVKQDGLYQLDHIYDAVTQYNVTMNNHHIGIRPEVFHNTNKLSKQWKITSTNVDQQGKPFVSTMEPIDPSALPVYAVQFHPEKNVFEYGLQPNTTLPYEAINHSPQGTAMSIHMANFFVQLARDNLMRKQQQGQPSDSSNSLSSLPMVYTYPRHVGYKFEEIYIIPPISEPAPQQKRVKHLRQPLAHSWSYVQDIQA
jgi:gamma-glutamyl hydrolase